VGPNTHRAWKNLRVLAISGNPLRGKIFSPKFRKNFFYPPLSREIWGKNPPSLLADWGEKHPPL